MADSNAERREKPIVDRLEYSVGTEAWFYFVPLEACPFPQPSIAADAWRLGWVDAERLNGFAPIVEEFH